MNIPENFRPAVDKRGNSYPAYYVSNDGKVGSTRKGGGAPTHHAPFHIIKPYTSKPYFGMTFMIEGKRVPVQIHVLVASAWVGTPEKLEMQVNHKDGNKKNNNFLNLEWTTRVGNGQHASRMGLAASGERNGISKLTEQEVRDIRVMAASGYTQIRLARLFGVSFQTISRVVRRDLWKQVA